MWGRRADTRPPEERGRILEANLPTIARVSWAAYRRDAIVQRVYGSGEDTLQHAALHCFVVCLHSYDGKVTQAVYFGRLAKYAIYTGLRTYREQRERGCPQTVYVEPFRYDQRGEVDQEMRHCLNRLDVATALQVVSCREAQALTLRYGIGGSGERSYAEVAAVMGIAEGTVDQTLKHALRRLRERFRVDGCGD